LCLALLGLALAACSTTPPPSPPHPSPPHSSPERAQYGEATFYGKNHHGGPTASGERFDMWALTAAHRTLRMNSRVRVTNLRNGRVVVVRINDRGPFGNHRRIIDLSYAAARALDMIEAGVVPVRLEVLQP
jgi:rare lipoprotein A